ncbi:unnamed protein product [Rhizophagus irregularis]|nr:unnamed protein product [Rhizophagus irregularis]
MNMNILASVTIFKNELESEIKYFVLISIGLIIQSCFIILHFCAIKRSCQIPASARIIKRKYTVHEAIRLPSCFQLRSIIWDFIPHM